MENDVFVNIGKAALLLGVSISTLRRWTDGMGVRGLVWFRTEGNHRRFSLESIQRYLGKDVSVERDKRIHVGYARVSSHDQKNDLATQIDVLQKALPEKGEVLSDLGSGLNYRKKGLRKLIGWIVQGKTASLTLTYKDRLLRFGADIVFLLCEHMNVKVRILNKRKDTTFEQNLVDDMVSLVTVFSARLYGRRSHKNRKAALASQVS